MISTFLLSEEMCFLFSDFIPFSHLKVYCLQHYKKCRGIINILNDSVALSIYV